MNLLAPTALTLLFALPALAQTPPSPAPAAPAAAPQPAAPEARGPLTLTYLGIAGWQLETAGHTLLVDPCVSRPLQKDAKGRIRSDPKAVAAHTPAKAELIAVTHSHIDHLLDAPAVSLRSGAQLLGSLSTARVALASGVAKDHVIAVKGGEDYQFDGFSVRVLPGLHSALDGKHSFGGLSEIPDKPRLPLTFDQYAEGGTFDYLFRAGGHEILVIGSANFIERELAGLRPDVAIVATGLREELHDYTCRLLRLLGHPPVVVMNHFDAWQKPLDHAMDVTDAARRDFEAFKQEVATCSPNTKVIQPVHFQPFTLE
jgi:L-ascorbate metabolism protein UlaG (beta-lactamase superfamily)